MDYSKIKDLINTIEASNLMDFELKVKGEFYIRMNKAVSQNSFAPTMPKEKCVKVQKNISDDLNTAVRADEVISEPMTIIPEDKIEVKDGNVVTAPMVGTFYKSSSPDKPAYVNVGDKVKKGDVLCVLEAMKIMNEITSAYDGEIAEIMVENEEMVEYNQPLFRII